jgi:uncharacterized membrane protein SirB2
MSNLETILIVILWIIIACFICHKRKWYAEFDNEQHFIVALTIISLICVIWSELICDEWSDLTKK